MFAKLKLTEDEHRPTMSQNKEAHLTVLSTEWDIMRRFNLHKVLSDFRAAKLHKQFIRVWFENGQQMKKQI